MVCVAPPPANSSLVFSQLRPFDWSINVTSRELHGFTVVLVPSVSTRPPTWEATALNGRGLFRSTHKQLIPRRATFYGLHREKGIGGSFWQKDFFLNYIFLNQAYFARLSVIPKKNVNTFDISFKNKT